jgi:FkbH-like protein
MDSSDFLFPTDLSVTPTPLRKILVVGSCGAESYCQSIRERKPDVAVDFILTNNLSTLPKSPPAALAEYDVQFVQIALREVLGDQIVSFADFGTAEISAQFARAAAGLSLRLEAALQYNRASGILTIVGNFQVPQLPVVRALNDIGTAGDLADLVRGLNRALAEYVAGYQNVFVCDIDAIAGSLGKRYTHDDVMSFYAHGAHRRPAEGNFDTSDKWNAVPRIDRLPALETVYETRFDELVDAIFRQWEFVYRVVKQVDQVKLVVFDLDDTLWRGQIADHYGDGASWPVYHGWPTGLWEAVHHLRARGILTAICSKNEASIVLERWQRTVGLRWIHPDHFVFKEINWRPKAENIANIIKAAGLTQKSVVFVDDNPVERQAVLSALPGIRVIGSNPYLTRRILLWSPETQVAHLSVESANREGMMKMQQEREVSRKALNREEFLLDLNARVELIEVNSTSAPEYGRMFELLNKTNQFNTTGRRWSHPEMVDFMSSGGKLYGFRVTDRFTDYGLVGVILYRDRCFEQFAMSCRVLGLDIEISVVCKIMRLETQTSLEQATAAIYIPTDVNMVCRSLYEQCGFKACAASDHRFIHDGTELLPPAPHLTLSVAASALVAASVG